MSINLEASWQKALKPEFQKDYMLKLKSFLASELHKKKNIYPQPKEYFAALNRTPLDKVRVVILGQDPYHGPQQAHGLCFSVRPEVKIPPSLRNIYKEMKSDLGIEPTDHGCLTHWADQGVLLLNATLSVEAGKAGSHQKKGWEEFTDSIIRHLAEEHEGLVFVLWGSYAQKKGAFIDRKKHHVIQSAHPSPLSAHRGFLGSKVFSRINGILTDGSQKPINWKLPLKKDLVL